MAAIGQERIYKTFNYSLAERPVFIEELSSTNKFRHAQLAARRLQFSVRPMLRTTGLRTPHDFDFQTVNLTHGINCSYAAPEHAPKVLPLSINSTGFNSSPDVGGCKSKPSEVDVSLRVALHPFLSNVTT